MFLWYWVLWGVVDEVRDEGVGSKEIRVEAGNERRRVGSVCGVGRVGGDVEGGGDDGRGWRESEWCSRQGQLVLHTTKYRRASGRVSERAAGLGEIWLGRVCFGAGVSPNKGLPSI